MIHCQKESENRNRNNNNKIDNPKLVIHPFSIYFVDFITTCQNQIDFLSAEKKTENFNFARVNIV
ncbi:hypothetical protein DERF_009965 [Dermatophagoides farinae]|uniref:Uncharacterized protein n=1 Tax=Dermatophagoides farinae TaxID=6954 RepID=A0A922HXN5_DERFA|nr:hypothetical protein DERF_009965 [Dermatophagoides farinae]